jgi:hypothetical protein
MLLKGNYTRNRSDNYKYLTTINTYVHTYTYYIHTCIHSYTYIHTYIYTHTHLHTHTHTHTYICTFIHACVRACVTVTSPNCMLQGHEGLHTPYHAAVSQEHSVASFATLRALSCLHWPGLRCPCYNVVRFRRALEACSTVTAT